MAERIQVSSEELQACAQAYISASHKLIQASTTYSKALSSLSSDWTGRAFIIMSGKVVQMLRNLSQSRNKCTDAIKELIQVKEMFEENESSLSSSFQGLDTGSSPFSM